jgi:hypothetical protein
LFAPITPRADEQIANRGANLTASSLAGGAVPVHFGAMTQDAPAPNRIEAEILRQLAAAAPGRSVDPGEVAKALDPEWQKLTSAVRRAAVRLAEAGRIDILRKGRRVEPAGVKGVIRLRLPTST